MNAAIAGAGGFGDFSGLAAAFGGGASWVGGVFTMPTFSIQGNNYNDVASAFAAVDSQLTTLAATSGLDVTYVDADDASTLDAAQQDADAGLAATLTASQGYTDSKAASTLRSANAYTDQKFVAWNDSFIQFQQQTDRRIDRNGAMQTAMAQMTASAAGIRTLNRLAVGEGGQNGSAAVSIGYPRAIGDNAAFTLGGAFSGGESSPGVGYGIGR